MLSYKNRLRKELDRTSDNDEFQIVKTKENTIKVTFYSTDDSPYVGIPLNIIIIFPNVYPFNPPCVYFIPNIFHSNITGEGKLDIPLLKEDWSPACTLEKLLLEIKSLFNKPFECNPLEIDIVSDKGKEEESEVIDICANMEALRLWKEDPETLRQLVLSQLNF